MPSLLPALATLALGAALLVPLRGLQRATRNRAPRLDSATFDGFLAAATSNSTAHAPPAPATDAGRAAKSEAAREIASERETLLEHECGNQRENGCESERENEAETGCETGSASDRSLRDRGIDVELAIPGGGYGARAVPLTRLPLRRRARRVQWLARPSGPGAGPPRDDGRYRSRGGVAPEEASDDELIAAYRHEDAAGRLSALRVLQRRGCARAREIFEDALAGGDAERAVAVDALAAAGARESLRAVLGDRVDAIAARAALAYVGTRERADYERILAPFVGPARLEVLLELLAGYVE